MTSISATSWSNLPDKEGRGFSWKGKTLLSGVDPDGRARRVAESIPVRERTLYLCPSPLYGYGLERLLERITDLPNTAVLCIEAEPELFALAQEHLNTSLKDNPKLRITDRCDEVTLCALLRREWGPRFFRRVEMVRLTGGWQLHRELYDMLTESLQREIALDWGNAMTLTRLGRRYIRNALRNLPLIPHCRPLRQLNFGDAPTLVLGAGPSLDKLLDGLQSRFGRSDVPGGALALPGERPFRIICVDTCLAVLRERRITPDLAVILECQHWNLDDFVGLSDWHVPAALDLSALPRSAHVLSGGLFLFFTPWTSLKIFERLSAAGLLPPRLPPLGSVGLSAAAIACRLTKGPIITAGIDFSFTPDSSHARSTPGHKGKLRRQNRFTGILNAEAAFGGPGAGVPNGAGASNGAGAALGAVSKTGAPVLSTPAMRNYRDLFEREFGSVMHNGAAVFDIEGSGLPLGVKTLSRDEALDALSGGGGSPQESGSPVESLGGDAENTKEEILQEFIRVERERLVLLRDMLTGAAAMDSDALVALVDECDYLWAHFPDYAASDRRPGKEELSGGAALSFLNRLRVEIDPFLKLWELVAT